MNDFHGDGLSLRVQNEDTGNRLDRFLADKLKEQDLSRSRLKGLIVDGRVLVDGALVTDPSLNIKAGMEIAIHIPEPEDAAPLPENIPLNIIYEDDQLLVIDKPAGLVVHPGAGHAAGTLVNALLYHCGDSLSGVGGVRRPGIVHRLDKDTSGLMVAAKTDRAHQALAAQLSDRSLSRIYKALVWGVPRLKKGEIDMPVGRHPVHRQKMAVNRRTGKQARTFYEVEQVYAGAVSRVSCKLESGRTHQIRVHMAELGYPLIGDPLYGLQDNAARARLKKADFGPEEIGNLVGFPRQALHASEITFSHPVTEKSMRFISALPEDMSTLIDIMQMHE